MLKKEYRGWMMNMLTTGNMNNPGAVVSDKSISLQPFWPFARKGLKTFCINGRKLFATYELCAERPFMRVKSVPGSLITGIGIPLNDVSEYSMVSGVVTEAVDVVLSRSTHTFGCHFFPGVFSAVFGIPSDVLPPDGVNLVDLLHCGDYVKNVQMARSQEDREDITVEWVRQSLTKHPLTSSEKLGLYLGDVFLNSRSDDEISRKMKEFYISERHIRRIMRANIGTTPKTAACNMRLQSAMRYLIETDIPLIEVAGECGYCDQSHLNNDFNVRLGFTPENFRKTFGVTKKERLDKLG